MPTISFEYRRGSRRRDGSINESRVRVSVRPTPAPVAVDPVFAPVELTTLAPIVPKPIRAPHFREGVPRHVPIQGAV